MDTTLNRSARALKRVLLNDLSHALSHVCWWAGLSALSLSAHAGVQIQDDPMRPALTGVTAAGVGMSGSNSALNPLNKTSADAIGSPPVAAQFSLKVTRANRAYPSVFVALIDDTWVKRGDLLAGHRVVAVNAESVELVDVANPAQRISLRMNPVTVQRVNSKPDASALAASVTTSVTTSVTASVTASVAPSSASAPLTRRRALEK